MKVTPPVLKPAAASSAYEGNSAKVVGNFFLSANPLYPVFTKRLGTPRLAICTLLATAKLFAVPSAPTIAITLSFKINSLVMLMASCGMYLSSLMIKLILRPFTPPLAFTYAKYAFMAGATLLYPVAAGPVWGTVMPSFISLLLTPTSACAGIADISSALVAMAAVVTTPSPLRFEPIMYFLSSRGLLLPCFMFTYLFCWAVWSKQHRQNQ